MMLIKFREFFSLLVSDQSLCSLAISDPSSDRHSNITPNIDMYSEISMSCSLAQLVTCMSLIWALVNATLCFAVIKFTEGISLTYSSLVSMNCAFIPYFFCKCLVCITSNHCIRLDSSVCSMSSPGSGGVFLSMYLVRPPLL